MVAGLQRIVDLLRAASGASSVTGQPSTVYVCHCMHVLGAEAAEDSKWGPLLPEEINGHANPNPNPNPYPNPNPNPNPDPNLEINPRVDELNALIGQLRDCAVVPLRMPREPSHFEPDGLHLSEHTGYPVLLAQLAAHVPLLAPSAR